MFAGSWENATDDDGARKQKLGSDSLWGTGRVPEVDIDVDGGHW